MKKWLVIVVLVAIAAPVLGARQTVVRTDLFGTGWTKQNSMNTELYQKTDPTETGFTGMGGEVITSGVVPSAKNLSPDKVSGVPSINFLYEANGADTNGFGFLGPANSTKNLLYRISDESPAVGNVFKVDSIATDQTITVGSGSIVADVVTLILADESGASGFTTFPVYKDSTGTKGQYAVNDAGTLLAMCVDTNSWRTVALTDTLAPTTPTLVSLTIPAAGTTAEAVFSEAMAIGAGGAGGWTLNDPTVAMTRTGGTGTVEDPVIFSLARTVLSTATENPYASYTQPTNGFESADDGVDLASITDASVTNNSTQTSGAGVTPVAKYSFESGALAVDSSGANTLTIVGAPTSDTVLFKELLASSKTNSSDAAGYYYIEDASLSSDFPLKSGTTNTSFSFTFWINQDSRGTSAYPIAKYAHTTNKRSLAVKIDQTTGTLSLLQGHTSGTGSEASLATTAITLGWWYHVGVTYDGSANGYKIRVWDDYNNTQLANVTGSFANSISLTGAKWMVNGYNDVQSTFVGRIDNLEFFDSVLSDAEIDARR